MNLPIIPNQNPPVTGVFDRYWMTRVSILRGQRVTAWLVPYDGTTTLNQPPAKISVAVADDAWLTSFIPAINAELQTRAGKSKDPESISIDAPHPDGLVRLTAIFELPTQSSLPNIQNQQNVEPPYIIEDLFGLAATDETVATLVGGLIQWVAQVTIA